MDFLRESRTKSVVHDETEIKSLENKVPSRVKNQGARTFDDRLINLSASKEKENKCSKKRRRQNVT